MSSGTGNGFFQVYLVFLFHKLLSKRGSVHFQNSFIKSVHEFSKIQRIYFQVYIIFRFL